MKHIFISHKKNDANFARVLIYELNKAGFSSWIDHDGLYGGDDWRAEIDQAIRDALTLIVVMTPDAKASEYVTYEWAFALGVGVKVIPVMLKDTILHPRLEALQHLNFTNLTDRPWDKLINAVKKAAKVPDSSTENVLRDAPPFIKEAVAALNKASKAERREALETLAQTNHPVAREALTEALQHPIKDVRVHAALVLVQFDNLRMRAIPSLLEAQYDEDGEVYRRAMRALENIGIDAVPYLLEALHNGDTRVRRNAARALGQIGFNDATPGLLAALHDKDVEVRRNAAIALGGIKSVEAVPGLLTALHDKDVEVRRNAAFALLPTGSVNYCWGEALASRRSKARRGW